MGRATGQALLGGGLLENVPGFQELATSGKALGDLMGGGDKKSAAKRYEDYVENSMIGSTVGAIVESAQGNKERANQLIKNAGKATLSAGATVGLTIVTGGLAAPAGTAVAVGAGASVGASTSVISTALDAELYNDGEADPGAMVGGAIFGGVLGENYYLL